MAVGAGARVAVLPCCHDIAPSDTGGLEGWIKGPLAVDVTRAGRLRSEGYTVITRMIPEDITPQNRLLMGHCGDQGQRANRQVGRKGLRGRMGAELNPNEEIYYESSCL
jgi:hypothetical protein